MKYTVYVAFIFLLFTSCRTTKIEKNAYLEKSLIKYIYPIDTIKLEGFIYYYESRNGFIHLFSEEELSLNRRIDKVIMSKDVAVYLTPYSFQSATRFPDESITHEVSYLKDSLIVKSILADSPFLIEKVQGGFIIGVTNTFRLNGIISHHYRFKKNKIIRVVTPL